jgi:hypothetical protein
MTTIEKNICVGEVVVSLLDWDAIGVDKGELGVVFEVYDSGRGHWGAQIIFEAGGHCGYSDEEIDRWIGRTGFVVTELANYKFRNIVQTVLEHHEGLFNKAWQNT